MGCTAVLGPPIAAPASEPVSCPEAASFNAVQIPVHRLSGEARVWADRLLALFGAVAFDGIEWSLKFSVDGLVGDRFLVGLNREHWGRLGDIDLREKLSIPLELWRFMLEDMRVARAAYFSYEPDEGAGAYRMYLEMLPPPDALRAARVLPLGRGYKWDPAQGRRLAVTDYRVRYLASPSAFDAYLQPHYERLAVSAVRDFAQAAISAAKMRADPCGFMFLEAVEADSLRESFSVTFRGTRLPLKDFVPGLLHVAGALALPAQQVLDHLVPDEPRSLCSLAAGITRGGQDFLTVYYD